MDYPSSMSINLLQCSPDAYQLFEKIDDKVYRGKYLSTGQFLAIKTINLEETNDTQLDNVKKDIYLTRSLRHENILPYLSCFLQFEHLWIVSPYCQYGSASELSKPSGLSELAISFIVRDTLSALEYIHNQGIIHRAIRGQHLLVYGPHGRCLLTGFQYATSLMHDGKLLQSIHTYPNNAKPNLNWLAPELLEQNLLGYTTTSDIYSLGITCCELANGCVPFADLQPTEMLLDKLTGNFPRPIDSNCAELFELPTDDLSEEERVRYEVYRNRCFSNHFHSFTVELCLHHDPGKRPAAVQLLSHKFFKQLKKLDTGINLLTVLDKGS
ncbi:STE20-related kinase adapter protein alpha [Tetranychus urticae]|uniref:Protein kinase domain-containing protein n=1 Tax=Tetranychus urticae TaxID=32264 RepID=T1KT87_TETUR|nr:STE20-related kinase adapter protein alpha [Tetranychus urticae]